MEVWLGVQFGREPCRNLGMRLTGFEALNAFVEFKILLQAVETGEDFAMTSVRELRYSIKPCVNCVETSVDSSKLRRKKILKNFT